MYKYIINTLNKIIYTTLLFLPPFFMSWTQRSSTFYIYTKGLFLSKIVWRPVTRTAAATIGLHNQRISAQTVRNRLRKAHLHARHPHRGLDLTAVHHRNRLEWANAHIRWRLALCRGVLFTDESRFLLYRADGRQRVWRRVGERFADVVVDRVAHGDGGVMVWAGICYGQWTQGHFIDGILNA